MLNDPSMWHPCFECGAPFFAYPSRLAKGGGRFCSRTCGALGRRRRPSVAPEIRFWAKVPIIEEPIACWMFQGTGNSSGYASIQCGELGQRMAHWYAWYLVAGEPPDGFSVCHDCPNGDQTLCVRNDVPGWKEINGILRPKFGHLWVGTPAENTADMFLKGRGMIGDRHTARLDPSYLPRGEAHVNSKLTAERVRSIRIRRAGGESIRTLATDNGVSRTTIENVLSGRIWGHVK